MLAGLFVATWFQVPYWATVTLSEIFAANLFCLCVHFGFLFLRYNKLGHLAAFGTLLGLVFSIRFQFSIFLFLTALLICSFDRRRWLLVAGCASGVIIVSGILDWITLGHPFQSIWLNALANSVVPISEMGMVHRSLYYLTDVELTYWSFSGAILLMVARLLGSVGIRACDYRYGHMAIAFLLLTSRRVFFTRQCCSLSLLRGSGELASCVWPARICQKAKLGLLLR